MNIGRLVLSRRAGESVQIGDELLTVVFVGERSIRLADDMRLSVGGGALTLVNGTTVQLKAVTGRQARLLFVGDRSINIRRTELAPC